jgi:hypothetical protein
MSLMELGPVMFGGTDGIIQFFRRKGLLSQTKNCTGCAATPIPMNEIPRTDLSDGVGWRCPNCRSRKSIRDGSFFSKSHLTLQQWLMLIFFWVDDEPVGKASEHCQVSVFTGINVYQWLREVCSTRLIQDGNPQLGGNGVVVEIDESCFRHKPKYRRGRPPTQNIWVFGMVDTSRTPALGFMQIVPNRTRATLLPIIQANTLPGTIIHSDDYATYRTAVGQLPNVARHRIVNHSLHFVDPNTNVHTQHVESYWNRVKQKFKRMRGVDANQLPSYIDEFMWIERYGTTRNNKLDNICRDITEPAIPSVIHVHVHTLLLNLLRMFHAYAP